MPYLFQQSYGSGSLCSDQNQLCGLSLGYQLVKKITFQQCCSFSTEPLTNQYTCSWSAQVLAAFPLGAIREVVNTMSIFKYFFVDLRGTVADKLTWSVSVGGIFQIFLFCLCLIGGKCYMCRHQIINENIECFAQNVLKDVQTFWYRERTQYATHMFRCAYDFAETTNQFLGITSGAKWSHTTNKYQGFISMATIVSA